MLDLTTTFFGSGSPMSVICFEELARASRVRACVVPATLPRTNELVRATKARSIEIVAIDRQGLQASASWLDSDVGVIGSFPWILPGGLLDRPRAGVLNVHPSRLPLHRGNAPILWTYLDDDLECGVSIHRATEEVDAGKILEQATLPLPRGQRYMKTYDELARAGAALISGALTRVSQGSWQGVPQQLQPVQRTPPPGELPIDLENWPAERVWHVMRGLAEVRKDLLMIQGDPVAIGAIAEPELSSHSRSAGTIIDRGRTVELYTRDGRVIVRRQTLADRIRRRVARSIGIFR